jgi:hypothetical protein
VDSRVGIYDLARLYRDNRMMLNLKYEMDQERIHLVVANMPGSEFDSAAGRFQFSIMCGAAQYQRDLDSEKAKRRMRYVFESKGHNGLDPFGYRTVRDTDGKISRPRHLEVIEHEKKIVQRVWQDLAHKPQDQVARDLNAEGVRRRTDAPWTKDAVKDIWRRGRFYLGFVQWRRPGHIEHEESAGTLHEPILDEQTYLAAVMAAKERGPGAGRRPKPFRTYIVKGLLEHECGRRMRGQALTSRDTEWRYYRCPNCPKVSVQADEVEQAVLAALRKAMLPLRVMDKARDELARRLRVPTTGLADKQRKRLSTALERIRTQHMWGDLTDEQYVAEKAQLHAQLVTIPDSDKLVQFDSHRKVVLSLAESMDKASPQRLAALVKLIVEKVPVVDGKVDPQQIVWAAPVRPFFESVLLEAPPEGIEPPTQALGRPRSIR